MPKSLNDVLKGVRKSSVNPLTTGDVPDVDYAAKMKDTRDFVAQHSVEKHDDRVGNDENVYKGSTKNKIDSRHGNVPMPKDIKVYNKANQVKEESEHIHEAKCNMTEAGKMCEVHGMKACPKEDDESASDKEPRYTGKDKAGKRKLLTDKIIKEMSSSQNQAIAARIALKNKKEGTMPPEGTASRSMMSMSKQQLHDFSKAKPGAPKKVQEAVYNHSVSKTASEKAREHILKKMDEKEKMKMKEQAAPVETPITFPARNSREGFDRI